LPEQKSIHDPFLPAGAAVVVVDGDRGEAGAGEDGAAAAHRRWLGDGGSSQRISGENESWVEEAMCGETHRFNRKRKVRDASGMPEQYFPFLRMA
jgi:hypothetical protein